MWSKSIPTPQPPHPPPHPHPCPQQPGESAAVSQGTPDLGYTLSILSQLQFGATCWQMSSLSKIKRGFWDQPTPKKLVVPRIHNLVSWPNSSSASYSPNFLSLTTAPNAACLPATSPGASSKKVRTLAHLLGGWMQKGANNQLLYV